MSHLAATPNVAHDDDADDARDIWAEAARLADDFIGITAAAIRDLWAHEHAAIVGDEAALVALALSGEPSSAREAAREALTAAYVGGPVKRIVSVHSRRSDSEDIRQSALEGLWRGLNNFDPAKHRRPVATIEREVLAALDVVHAARFGMKIPEAQRLAYSKARDEAARRTVAEDGSGPYVDDLAAEIAPEFGLSTVDYWHVRRVVHFGEVQANGEALEATARRSHSEGGEPIASLWEAATPNVTHEPLVAAMLDGLDDREREVIARMYGLDGHPVHTEAETGHALGLTVTVEQSKGTGEREKCRRVRQIQAAALAKLRSTLGVSEGAEGATA
jgi:DNA-directed RNA polymerase specialized sigma subunit